LAQSRQLVAQSELLQVNQPARVELSTLLELESIRTARTPENDRALRETSSLLLASRFSTKSGRGLQRVALSPNGRWLAVGGQEKLTRVFDLSTAKQVAAISHTGWVWAICFSQDGQYLLSAGDDGTAIAIRLTAATEVMRLRGAKGVRTAVFSPHGQQVALGSYSDAAVYEFPSGRLVSRWEHRDAVFSVAFSRDGALLGTGSADHKARLFEIGQQQMGLALPHDEKVMDVKFSPTRDFMATASADGTVRGFDVGSVRERWRYVATKLVHRLDFSPDGARLAVASFDGITRVLNVDSGQEVSRFTHKGSVSAVAFSPDGLWVASASEDETARIFDASTGREIRRIGMSSAVQDLAWDGRTRLLAVGAQDGSVTVVDAAPSRDLAWRPKFSPMPPSVSPDGRWLLRGDAIGHLTVSAVEDGTAVDALEAMDCSLIACFSVDGRSLGRARRNSYVEIVSVPDAHLTFRRRIPNASGVLAVSTKAQYAIVAATPGGAMLFATSDESNIRELARDELVVRASFSPDGARFALAGSDGTVRVFALGTDQELWRARFKKPASAIAFSPDGTVLAAGSYDRTATLFDAHSGRERLRISEDAPVREVAIGPNQSWWAVGTEDGQVHIYESLTSHQWSQVDARGDYVSLAFGKLGRELVSAASTVDTLWMRKTMLLKEDLIASACASLSRNLTIAEFQLFLPDQPRRRTCVDLP
jgi:WD40 repeat protein